ncbi:MAG: hypothetical protein RhofKO_14940 [Rhodothermales bacterium]
MALNPKRSPVARKPLPSAEVLAEQIVAGDRQALSQAITLVESVHPEHHELARAVLRLTEPKTGRARRIGITGIPGAGKSTLIEALGTYYLQADHRVGVIAVDPSSPATSGSILGDKTRMPTLSTHPNAFVRPSPNRGLLGGLSATTYAVRHLLEAAGYDLILIETVGVGQADVEIQHLVDVTLLLTVPGTGDDLQGIKRGSMEIADLIAVNKADGEQRTAAQQRARQLRSTLHLSGRSPQVLLTSAFDTATIAALAQAFSDWYDGHTPTLPQRRALQTRTLTQRLVQQRLNTAFWSAPELQTHLQAGGTASTALDAADQLYQVGIRALTST